jgi:prepilin-type N-terminal cleavage/methylation domain-containing protein
MPRRGFTTAVELAHGTRRNRGYTLLELMLVVAIIVVVAGMSLQSLPGMYAAFKDRAAADTVRGAWATARSHAIDDARPYRFAIIPNKGNFRVAPDSSDWWNGGDPSGGDGSNTATVLEGTLPKGIRFTQGDAMPDATDRSSTIVDGGDVNPSDWVRVATFMPDGTASEDVEISFRSGKGRPVVLRLRGLTGTVTSGASNSNSGPQSP